MKTIFKTLFLSTAFLAISCNNNDLPSCKPMDQSSFKVYQKSDLKTNGELYETTVEIEDPTANAIVFYVEKGDNVVRLLDGNVKSVKVTTESKVLTVDISSNCDQFKILNESFELK